MLIESEVLEYIDKLMKRPLNFQTSIIDDLIKRDMLVRTDDGTYTFRSEDKTELMHSRIGALKEAFEKFADPSEIKTIETPRLLDLCSGLGYNSLAALMRNSNVHIDMVEISRELIFISQYLPLPQREQKVLRDAVSDYFHKKKNPQIVIYCEDARKALKHHKTASYDVVFHDGFSPANEPVLYSVDFLSLLYRLLDKKGILLSYSSSIPFRSALIEAGFFIGEGPSVGRQRGITIASKDRDDTRIRKRLSIFDEQLIALSTIGIPYYDKELKDSSSTIKKRREDQREKRKNTSLYIPTKKIKKQLIDKSYRKIQEEASDSKEAILLMKELQKNK